ncbi:MAG TPA: ATP-binding protein [Thioploca sp.]|nr:ATP-binding protein [Thioploca sp.]
MTEPIVNPFVAGNPVTGSLFVGRDDVLRRLEELWTVPKPPSVILYGHRRMGKTSILQNLGTRFGNQSQIIDFNMQRVGFVKDTSKLLYNLALTCYDSLAPEQQSALGEPTAFSEDDPYNAFDRFLKKWDKHRQNQRLLVTVDEFELIEKGINAGRLDPNLLDFWRATIQTYPWFIMAFAGLHNLEEMRHDYWHPLFCSFKPIIVSFLGEDAAQQLITQPDPDFPLDYDTDAINEIINLTRGQPYLVQLICHSLVSRFNRQTFEEGVERERRFTLHDVRAVIESKEFFRDGNAYFAGVWVQAESADNAQQTIMKTLADATDGLTIAELAVQTQLSDNILDHALTVLARHDVVVKQPDKVVYTVELMRRWVREKVPAEMV